MKKIISLFIVAFCLSVHGQVINKKSVAGSWINAGVSSLYESSQSNVCDTNYFEKIKIVPLYISFLNDTQVKITYRLEQKIVTYNVKYATPDTIIFYSGKTSYKVALSDNMLKLFYKGNLISFKKVSHAFSKDVMGEFIKNLIFTTHKSYLVDTFKSKKNDRIGLINRENLKDQIKKIFGCNYVDFVQLGFLKFNNVCLPEIALYYNDDIKYSGPQVFGVLKEKDNIRFVDRLGNNILSLKPN